MLWTVPRMWPGETVYILGGGPSLRKVPVVKLQGRHVIALNRAYEIAPWAEVKYANDCWFMQEYGVVFAKQNGIKVTICTQWRDHPKVFFLETAGRTRLAIKRNELMAGDAGYGGINLAVHLGAKKIILLGYDMKKVGGEANWHNGYKRAMRDDIYQMYLGRYPTLLPYLREANVEVINATPGSALTIFPIVDPSRVI